jgi:undecaprenyl-diphosphatase
LRVNWDQALFQAINGLAAQSALADEIALTLTRSSTLLVPGLLLLGYLLWRDRRQALILVSSLVALFLLGDLLGAQLKHLVARVRPCHALTGVHQLVGCGGTFSFPSNHALNTAAAAAFAQVLFPASGWVTWPLVAAVGVARVYVGAHYVSDVLGGWTIGVTLGIAAACLLRRWSRWRVGGDPSKSAP